MKKRIAIIIMFVLFAVSLSCVEATHQNVETEPGLAVVVNGEDTEFTALLSGGTHYVPARMVFEKLGAQIFFRTRDQRILILSRDGDIIQHVVGSNILAVNGEQKTFSAPSVTENNVTYISTDMLDAALRAKTASFENGRINIKKKNYDTAYGKIVNDVLGVCRNANFYPERFKRYINYHAKKPESSMQDVIFMVNLGLDFPFYENVSVISNPQDVRVLVNKYNRLPWEFKPENLVNMDRKYTICDGKQYLLQAEAYQKFVQMADAAKKEGLSLRCVSAYRTEAFQRNLYNKNTRIKGKGNVDNYSARPGFSEHQTGLAVDINSTKTSFEKSAEFRWLQNHAHEYGFILRYPKGKRWITGYEYEPWHYRYVGAEAAKIIHEEDSTYEQYYAKHISRNEFK